MPVSSVLCHLSRHLVSGNIVFHQVSPSQLWSASISLSVYLHLQYLASFQMSTFLTWSSLVFPLAHHSMRISVVCNFLSSFFLTAQHYAPYTMTGSIAVLYTLSFNFVGMFLSHIAPVVSLHFDQAIFTLLFTSFSAPPLASNIEPRYLNVFTVFTSFS